jgi:hypothetical protein
MAVFDSASHAFDRKLVVCVCVQAWGDWHCCNFELLLRGSWRWGCCFTHFLVGAP